MLTALYISGSFASIFGLSVSLYVLWRELHIEQEVHELKCEEEAWHEEKVRK